ncbi:helix-turn-helix transcriptional regulator [Occultella kanbiaonis]|uniref:helix-turn-helix transcriptional regulator n=1 Tax=Occultella kanbiaonis TaxID=2675754 RepID=UPI0013D29E41|nr:WYL domain-containing protein [Occultella kanbiaonis]
MSERVEPAERLLDLVIALANTPHRMTKSQIRRGVNGYADARNDAAFDRMFERDKEALRTLGVPIVTLTDAAHEDDIGYRIDTDSYDMPPVAFTPAEVGALSLAAEVWQDSTLSAQSRRALTKVRAVSELEDAALHAGLALRVRGPDANFGALLDAIADRITVRFTYRAANTGRTKQRTVEPWRLYAKDRGWYLVGHDIERAAEREFRLSRIVGRVGRIGEPGSVQVPDRASAHREAPIIRATLALRPERASALRARAVEIEGPTAGAGPVRAAPAAQVPRPSDRDVIAVDISDLDLFAEELAGYGDAVLVLDPPRLREAVLARLRPAASLGGES